MDPAGQFIQYDLLDKILQGVASPLSGKTVLVYDDALRSYDFGPHHPLKPIRLKLAVELSKSIGVLKSSKVSLVEPSEADVEQILLFHTREYVNLVERSSMTGRDCLIKVTLLRSKVASNLPSCMSAAQSKPQIS